MSDLAHKSDYPPQIDVTAANNPDTPPHGDPFICARKLSDLRNIPYPEGITGIRFNLDKDSKHGLFRYDRAFLLQFMPVCKGRPTTLAPLEHLGLDPSSFVPLPGRHSRRSRKNAAVPPRQGSIGQVLSLGVGSSFKPLGKITGYIPTPTSRLTSEERFALSCATQPSGSGGIPRLEPRPSRESVVAQEAFRDSPTAKTTASRTQDSKEFAKPIIPTNVQAAPISHSAVVSPDDASAGAAATPPLVGIEDCVRNTLGDLTKETFEAVLQQVVLWANKSEDEKDGHTLKEVIRVVFEVATTDAAMPEICASLLKAMENKVSHTIRDHNFLDIKGAHVKGSMLLRKHVVQAMLHQFDHIRAPTTAKSMGMARNRSVLNGYAAMEVDAKDDNETNKLESKRILLMTFAGELFKNRVCSSSKISTFMSQVLESAKQDADNIEPLCALVEGVGRGPFEGNKAKHCLKLCMTAMKEWREDPSVAHQRREVLRQVIQGQEGKLVTKPPHNLDGAVIHDIVASPDLSVVKNKDASQRKDDGTAKAQYTQDGADPVPGTGLQQDLTEIGVDSHHEDGGNNERTVVEFLERLVRMEVCSVALIAASERPGVIESIVDDIASRAPDAFRKLTLMIKAGKLD